MDHLPNTFTRRSFIKASSLAAGAFIATPLATSCAPEGRKDVPITIDHVNSNFEREPLIRPFGFKGGYMSEIWQIVSLLKSTAGNSGRE